MWTRALFSSAMLGFAALVPSLGHAAVGSECTAVFNPQLCADLKDTSKRTVIIPADEELTVANWRIPLGKRIIGPGSILLNVHADAGLIIDPSLRVVHVKVSDPKRRIINNVMTATVIEGVFFSRNKSCLEEDACNKFAVSEKTAAQACNIKILPGGRTYLHQTAKKTYIIGEPGHILIRNNEFRNIAVNRTAICGGATSTSQSEYERFSKPAAVRRRGAPAFGLSISGNSFIGFKRHVALDQVEHVTIQDNIFTRSIGSSIVLRSEVGKTLIEGNQFFDIGNPDGGGDSADAIDSQWSGDQLTIANNVIRRVAVFGLDIKNMAWSDEIPLGSKTKHHWPGKYIDYKAGRSGSRGVIISGNNISETQASAIRIAGAAAQGSTKNSVARLGHPNHSILISGNVVHEANTRCDNSGAIQVTTGAVRYVNITGNAVTNTCGHGIEVHSLTSADKRIPGDQTGIERLHRIIGVRINGNMVVNNGRRCMASELTPLYKVAAPFEFFRNYTAYLESFKAEVGAGAAGQLPPGELAPSYEHAICAYFRTQREDKNIAFAVSFGITAQGVFGLEISNNTVGNDVDLYHPLFPLGAVRTYSDTAIHVVPPKFSTNANISVGAGPPEKRVLSEGVEVPPLSRIKDNTVFCSIQARPKDALKENIRMFPGVVDASNVVLGPLLCP